MNIYIYILCANVEINTFVIIVEIYSFVCLNTENYIVQASLNCYLVFCFDSNGHPICHLIVWFFVFFLFIFFRINMFKRNLMLLNVCLYVITALYNIDNAYAARCSRIPEGSSNNYRSISRGNFRIRIKDDLNAYKPGRTYTG